MSVAPRRIASREARSIFHANVVDVLAPIEIAANIRHLLEISVVAIAQHGVLPARRDVRQQYVAPGEPWQSVECGTDIRVAVVELHYLAALQHLVVEIGQHNSELALRLTAPVL